jgi:hypothetical protein
MIELPLIFLGGLLGSAHCVGMCGGFALMVGAGARGWRHNLGRQIVYSLGRLFTYSVAGAALGYLGLRLVEDLPGVIHTQAVLAIVAGALLVTQGLTSAGVVARGRALAAALKTRWTRPDASAGHAFRHNIGVGCLATGMLGAFLRKPGLRPVFLAGMLTGLLPCGLVYAYLALAASTSDFFAGFATMAAFGLGTVPLMVATGGGASLLSLAARRRLFHVAAWCVVITGLLSLARGMTVLDRPRAHESTPACPLCR